MPMRVLVVEDNLDWEIIWKQIFDVFAEKVELVWATNVAEAMTRIGYFDSVGTIFDVIVADIFLSGSLTGVDLFNYLDQRHRQRFIFVSSVSAMRLRALLGAGGDDVRILQKPFTKREAISELRLIQKSVGNEQELPPPVNAVARAQI